MTTMTSLFKHDTGHHSRALSGTLWLAQGLLALMFGMVGYMKLFYPMSDLAISMPWTLDVPDYLVRFIGVAELLGAAGILLPALVRFMPELTVYAALGLLSIMVLATGFHMLRGEYGMFPAPVTLGLIAAFVAWGRFYREPIH